ncbi:MAG: ROK family protein [Candidatus Kapabacteria bacterium]|nr:ROK family protein [Candidatus Kapabacteria bacterium]
MALQAVTLGIDIGGTNTVLGVVDAQGVCLAETFLQTRASEPVEYYLPRLYDSIESLYSTVSATCEMKGIGIGAPNGNYYSGTIEQAANLNWGDIVYMRQLVHERFGVPVALTNDANAAALGEMLFGAARGMKHFLVVTLGTGLGSGIMVNGDVLYGSDGFAGELGHTIVKENGRMCGCGRRGCLETYSSASGIRRTMVELFAERTESSGLRDVSFNAMTAAAISAAAQAGDTLAQTAFELTGATLGKALANVIACFSPEAVILFGGLANAGDLILNPTRRAMEETTLNIFQGKTRLLLSELMDKNAAVLGASALMWKELEKLGTL